MMFSKAKAVAMKKTFFVFVFLLNNVCWSKKMFHKENLSLQDIIGNERDDTEIEYGLNAQEKIMMDSQTILDHFGFQLNWTNSDESWTEDRKKDYFWEMVKADIKSQQINHFTENGYEKMQIPSALYQLILKQRDLNLNRPKDESCDFHGLASNLNCMKIINEKQVMNRVSFLIPIAKSVGDMIKKKIKSILSKWAKTSLEFQAMYGIRRYLRGAQLLMHTDKLPSHIISAILQIDQKVDQEWPLNLVDHHGNKKSIYLKPGEMLLYESASVPHGRQFIFQGEYFDNFFIHFSPTDPNLIHKMD